jgi:hypothetical protein
MQLKEGMGVRNEGRVESRDLGMCKHAVSHAAERRDGCKK